MLILYIYINIKINYSLGFLDMFINTKYFLIREIKRLKETFPRAKIICTGHSLGAALS